MATPELLYAATLLPCRRSLLVASACVSRLVDTATQELLQLPDCRAGALR